MSIFPKRTLPGNTVTIHWNFNTSSLRGKHICPLVRIGVKDPTGKITMLFEKHVLALPGVDIDRQEAEEPRPLYLNKNLPLLILATYLSGKDSREKLVDILENIQAGRHYYFSYAIAAGAPPGKYTLISEVICDGEIRHSKTAEDDFFFVEKVTVEHESPGWVKIVNHSPEPTPIRIIHYKQGKPLNAADIEAFELAGSENRQVAVSSASAFLSYNEERELIPLAGSKFTAIRNPYVFALKKEGDDILYLLHRQAESGYMLDEKTSNVWNKADGITPAQLVQDGHAEVYNEMLNNGVIYELDDFKPAQLNTGAL